jgi:AhpD family alkylhydroperoxidase
VCIYWGIDIGKNGSARISIFILTVNPPRGKPRGGFKHDRLTVVLLPWKKNWNADWRRCITMALSISIVTKCEPCMEWHLDQALQAGATDEQIYETIDVAIEMGGGQAKAYAHFVLKALDYFKSKK